MGHSTNKLVALVFPGNKMDTFTVQLQTWGGSTLQSSLANKTLTTVIYLKTPLWDNLCFVWLLLAKGRDLIYILGKHFFQSTYSIHKSIPCFCLNPNIFICINVRLLKLLRESTAPDDFKGLPKIRPTSSYAQPLSNVKNVHRMFN